MRFFDQASPLLVKIYPNFLDLTVFLSDDLFLNLAVFPCSGCLEVDDSLSAKVPVFYQVVKLFSELHNFFWGVRILLSGVVLFLGLLAGNNAVDFRFWVVGSHCAIRVAFWDGFNR